MEARVLLLPLLAGLLGGAPGARAQACSVSQTVLEIEENTHRPGPLVDIDVPSGQQVTLGPSSTPFAFRIEENRLYLNVTPDYEEHPVLQAHLECRRGDAVVTQLRLFVMVLDVNDNPPVLSFVNKTVNVSEDTKVNSIVIPETELEAKDPDKDDILFYTLQEETPGAGDFFSLVGANRPALRLDRTLDFDRCPAMSFRLLVRDTQEEGVVPSHTATASLTLAVLPADLRPPWFLPCIYADAHVCLQAQYQGAVPTGHRLPAALILHPGPVYAVDGDRGINQPILYSIVGGNDAGTFAMDRDSGNLTMASSIPSPTTFSLLVEGKQADLARYSVTQVTVEARAAAGSPPRFPQGLYRGAVALGTGAGQAIRDAADPSQPLRLQAQDPDFPDINSAITYRVTNLSEFRMEGELVVTAARLEHAGLFYAEVEAKNTVTLGTAATVIEVQVWEQEPPTTGEPTGSPTSPETGRTPGLSSTTAEAPSPPRPSQGPSTTSSGGATGPRPPPPASPTPGGPPSAGTSTSSPSATSSGGSAPTPKPGTSQPMPPGPSRTPRPSEAPGVGGGSTAGDGAVGGHAEDRRFSVAEMAALGGVLGALLLLAIIALVVLVHKHHGHRLRCCAGKALEPQPGGYDNQAFSDGKASWAPAPSPAPAEAPPAPPEPAAPAPPSPASAHAPGSPAAARAGGSPAAMRSILTKERRPEGGYKAVWFGEDIGAEADVVILNEPARDGDDAGDSGSEGSGAEDAPDADSTDI
ncbi:cadherin-related family member 5 isoform X1 [Choloepus didactylus]|uniref:cadherin-related family member 5 isoform X1 n=1 Tax=Choloepus didactylus TaxID=27675 RepID=UPI0018A0FF1B|nr:cadherin-related family member 5 isoform X1 [Choloepus didactylus]